LGFRFLDTGATYRATALAALREGVDWNRPAEIARLAENIVLAVEGPRVFLNGEDVSEEIRTQEVTDLTHFAADNADVRRTLVQVQRRMAGSDDVVTEGRDQGTVVFPDAEFKFFVTATPEERARRRVAQLKEKGKTHDFEEILQSQRTRDHRDRSREVGPLVQPVDAVEIQTDGMTVDEVVSRIVEEVRSGRVSTRERTD